MVFFPPNDIGRKNTIPSTNILLLAIQNSLTKVLLNYIF